GGPKFSRSELDFIRERLPTRTVVRHLTGDDTVLANLYTSAALLICPSHYEGFGLPPLEAMAHGCPVACSASSSLLELYSGAAEMFDPADPSSIANAATSVLFSEDKTTALRKAGLQRAEAMS